MTSERSKSPGEPSGELPPAQVVKPGTRTVPRRSVAMKAANPGRPYRRRFKNFLLNKSLQLRYIGVVTVISALLLSALGTMIWQQKNLASSQILQSLDTLCEPGDAGCNDLRAELDDDLTRRDTYWVLRLVGIGVGLVFVLFFLLLVMTHKVAGPLYKVSLYFDRMAEGNLGETYPLRRGDMLRDFYAKFKEMHDAVRDRHREENQTIGRFLAACEAAGVERTGDLGSQLDELEALHEEREQALA